MPLRRYALFGLLEHHMNLPAVAYRIHASDPAAHRFEVVVEVAVPHPEGQEFSLPVWIPGSYLVREFSKSIVSIAAENSAGPVALHQLDKCTWRADPTEGPLRVGLVCPNGPFGHNARILQWHQRVLARAWSGKRTLHGRHWPAK